MTPSLFYILLTGSVGLDVLVAASVLFRRRNEEDGVQPLVVDTSRAAVAFAWASSLFALRAFVVEKALHAFAAINITYVTLVVSLPLIGLMTLIVGWRRPGVRLTPAVRVMSVLLLLPALVGGYATFIEPYQLQLERANIPLSGQRLGSAPIRIGVLADLQTTHVSEYELRAVERMMALQPDILVLPGDLFQGDAAAFARQAPALQDLLARLTAPGGVYFVLGNVDLRSRIERIIAGTNVRLLVNETVTVTLGERRLTIGGVELKCNSSEAVRVITEMERTEGDDDVRILVAHLPDAVLGLQPDTRVDLTIAGHTHGGQVVFPFLGPPITLSNVPRRVAAGGHHVLDGRHVYVSRGIGCERGLAPRVRLFCPPEITLLTLGD